MNLDSQILFKNALDHLQLNEFARAEDLLQKALIFTPNNPDILRVMAIVAALNLDFDGALKLIDHVIAITPDNGVAHSNRGNILKEMHRYTEALESLDISIALLPDYAEAHNNKGNVLQELFRFEQAIDSYDKALKIDPNYAEAYSNKGNALEWLRCHKDAMENFNKATAINPQYVDAYWHKALNQLASGNFELGWQNYEARWFKSHPVKFLYSEIPRLESVHNITGKKVLVWAEQGLGDTIQFCRYIKLLSKSGAHLTFLVPKQLVNLLSSLRQFCDLKSCLDFQAQAFDFQSPLLSLPLLFNTTLNSIPSEIPYLKVEEDKKKIFENVIAPSLNLKVGVVWSGGHKLQYADGYLAGLRRNIGLEQIARLKEVKGIDFYNLQKGDPAESELRLKKEVIWPEIIDCTSLLNDFSDTAALIDSLDLIISVDTSIVHLAGALGKSIWILNRYDSCWRWIRDRTDSPWYPTATIYQQSSPCDWDGVLEMVKVDLLSLGSAHLQKLNSF